MVSFDINHLADYRENNQLEAKSAKGGFPGSFWKTYSAFANSDGGIILLGVKENNDGSLRPEKGINAAKLRKEFWTMVNNRQKISANIVTDSMVTIETIDGNEILVVKVPRADRIARPVYVGLDPKSGTYRRNYDGDYHCSIDEMSLMFRDAATITADTKVLKNMDNSVFCPDTISNYRTLFRHSHHNHLWNTEENEIFLRKIGAIGISDDGSYHPTAAGLLMFGYEYEITREFPNYFLDYHENRTFGTTRWVDRIVSTSGDWSGNIFDFFQKVLPKLQSDLKVPFILKDNARIDDTPIHNLLREALTNACVHADFYGRQGLVIQKSTDEFKFTNPGTIRISISEAINGGISDPRNSIMLKMFSLIEYGERAGSGLSGILHVWEKVFHTKAEIKETNHNGVSRTTLILPTNNNQQDINAMLKLYENTANEPQNTANEPQNTRNEPLITRNEPQNTANEPQNTAKQIITIIQNNPKITKVKISQILGISLSTLKRHIKANNIHWVGPSKSGHWELSPKQ